MNFIKHSLTVVPLKGLDCYPEYNQVYSSMPIISSNDIAEKYLEMKPTNEIFRLFFLYYLYDYELNGNLTWDDIGGYPYDSIYNSLGYYINYIKKGYRDRIYYRKVLGI